MAGIGALVGTFDGNTEGAPEGESVVGTGALVGTFDGNTEGAPEGESVGTLVGIIDGSGVGESISHLLSFPPPHVQHASLAVLPAFSNRLP